MHAHAQSINLPNVMPGVYTNNTLNAALVASTDTAVLRPNAAGTMDSTLYAEQGTLAANGLALAFLQPGIYSVEVDLIQAAATPANTFAALFGNTTAPLVFASVPTFATAGLIKLVPGVTTPAGAVIQVSMNFTLAVRLATAKVTPSTTSSNVLKLVGVATAGTIVTGLTAAGWSMRVLRSNDLYA